MSAPKGNEYYKLAVTTGRPKIFKQPKELEDKWNEYVQFCLDYPLMQKVVQKRKISRDEEIIEIVDVPHVRAFTLKGFCGFIGIVSKTFFEYAEREEFSNICTYIQEKCYAQKFEGAASGFYNASIIARDLGLAEKTDVTTGGEKINPVSIQIDGKDIVLK